MEDRMSRYNPVLKESELERLGKQSAERMRDFDHQVINAVIRKDTHCFDGFFPIINNAMKQQETINKECDEKPNGGLTEDDVEEYLQDRSLAAGERGSQLAWMFVIMMTGSLVSGKIYDGFLTAAVLSVIYMMLSGLQVTWQTFTAWLFKRKLKKMPVAPTDYPSWVGAGAWFFFWLKMAAIFGAVCHIAISVFF